MEYNGYEILRLYLEFVSLQPDRELWNAGALRDKPDMLYRLQRLTSLFKAFDLGDLEEFHEGGFILKRNIEDYSIVIESIKSKTGYRYVGNRQIALQEISDMFKVLLQYCVEAEKVLRFGKDVNKAGGICLFTYDKIRQTNTGVHLGMFSIDNLLSQTISPSKKEISTHDLIAQYGCPEVDLTETEREWL